MKQKNKILFIIVFFSIILLSYLGGFVIGKKAAYAEAFTEVTGYTERVVCIPLEDYNPRCSFPNMPLNYSFKEVAP